MQCNLAVIKGDGIGPEVVTEAMKVLDTVGEKSDTHLSMSRFSGQDVQ